MREGLVLAPKARGRCKGSGIPSERKQLRPLHKMGLDDMVVSQECQMSNVDAESWVLWILQ